MRRSAGILGVGAMLAAVVVAGTAHSRGVDYVDCEFAVADGILEVTEQGSEVALIRRDGERIAALQPDGGGGFEEVDCGVTAPSVSNTEEISYRLTSDGITEAQLSLARGPLAPGRTDEGSTSEIETVVRPSPRTADAELSIRGTVMADHIRAGMLGSEAGVNLNVAAEAADPDVDVTVKRPGQVMPSFSTGEGDDTLDLSGGPEMTGPLEHRFAIVAPGAGADLVRSPETSVYAFWSDGADTIELGERRDIAEGGRGEDVISTAGRGDLILPGPGRDVVSSGAGQDQIFGASGGIDAIDCGTGRDQVFAGPRDELTRCERVERVPEQAMVHFGFD